MIKEIYWTIVPERIRFFLGKYLISKEKKMQEQIEFEKRKEFYANLIKKGDLYFDIGANIGNRIAPMLEIGAKIVAVEPQLLCVKRLKSLFGDNIIIEHKGLGAKEEVRDFYISNQSVLSTFSTEQIEKTKNGRFSTSRWKKPISMPITTMDILIAKYGQPAFVKIDVEGFELEVLKGMSNPVKMLSLEYTVPEMSDQLLDCLNRLYQISDKYVFNYSVGESMEFALEKWLCYDLFLDCVKSKDFIKTSFGDIYAKVIDL